MRRYGSFVVRWWDVAPGQRRLRIRHVQSDAEVTVAALPEAQDWMAARVEEERRGPPAAVTGTESDDGGAGGPGGDDEEG